MDDYDPSELIAICESILEDGEISGEELYGLADWLNSHASACSRWPGNLLVQPLQDVWADGKVTKPELRQVGRILLRIRKDWAKRQAEDAFVRASNTVVDILPTLDLNYAQVPSIPFMTRIKSHTNKEVFYDVDLADPKCTCPDWRSYRHSLPIGHLNRCCKHVFDAYAEIEPEQGWPGWLGAFFALAHPPNPQQNWIVFSVRETLVLASTATTGWVNVFADEGGAYDRFGYSMTEGRWAYGIAPTASQQIVNTIFAAAKR